MRGSSLIEWMARGGPRRLVRVGIDGLDQWLTMVRRGLEKNYSSLDDLRAGM